MESLQPDTDLRLTPADPVPPALRGRKRRIDLTYRAGTTLSAIGVLLFVGFERWSPIWTQVIAIGGIVLFVIGGITILIWGSMSRRFKKRVKALDGEGE